MFRPRETINRSEYSRVSFNYIHLSLLSVHAATMAIADIVCGCVLEVDTKRLIAYHVFPSSVCIALSQL
jgi:hypothetical protein